VNRHPFAVLLASPIVVALGLGLLKGQASTSPVFEVASLRAHPISTGVYIRPWLPTFQCPPKRNCGILGNRFREDTVRLAELIVDAYGVKKFQIAGLPPWGESDVYDLEAKVAGEIPPTVDQVRLMLQAFLADRFQLRIHHETRLLPVYELFALNKGIKVVPAKGPCVVVPANEGHAARTLSDTEDPPLPWAFYVETLAISAHQPVIDKTGLEGGDGYCTENGVDPLRALSRGLGGAGSVFNAVEEAWGMKLEARKAPVDVIVIDKVEKPSEN